MDAGSSKCETDDLNRAAGMAFLSRMLIWSLRYKLDQNPDYPFLRVTVQMIAAGLDFEIDQFVTSHRPTDDYCTPAHRAAGVATPQGDSACSSTAKSLWLPDWARSRSHHGLSLPAAVAARARSQRCPRPRPQAGCALLRRAGHGGRPSDPDIVVSPVPCAVCSSTGVRGWPCWISSSRSGGGPRTSHSLLAAQQLRTHFTHTSSTPLVRYHRKTFAKPLWIPPALTTLRMD